MQDSSHRDVEGRLHAAERLSILALGAAVLLLGAGVVVANRDMRRVRQSHDVAAQLDQIETEYLRGQSSHRAYLLTRAPEDWSSYVTAERRTQDAIRALATLTGQDTQQSGRTDVLDTLLQRMATFRAATIGTPQLSPDSARTMLDGPERQRLRDSIADLLRLMDRHEQALFVQRDAALTRAGRAMIGWVLVLAILSAGLGIGVQRRRRRSAAAAHEILRDLTARLDAERERDQSQARYRAVLDAMGEGVVLQDEQLVIKHWNPAAERILGLTGDQLAGKTSFDPSWRAVDEDGEPLPGERHMAAIAMRTGAQVTGTMGVERAGRDRVWITVTAVPLFRAAETAPHAVVVTFADITAARDARARIEESETRYRLLADHSADLVSQRDLNHTMIYASPSHLQILGWQPEEIVGKSGFGLIHPEDRERIEQARTDHLRSGDAPVLTSRARHKDGHYVWLEATSSTVRAPDGTIEGYITSARDITARRALEDELRQSQKMEVMGRMASGIAHDFNNLLTVIRSSAELLRMDARRAGVTLDAIAEIDGATDRATALTTHLLTFSRRQHYAPKREAVAGLVQSVEPFLRRMCPANVQLHVDTDPQMAEAWIWADPVRIERVFTNLASNACDAMPAGGTLRVSCSAIAFQTPVNHRFGIIQPGRYVAFRFEDSGTGIAPSTLENLFDPFFTTKPQGRGTGLGLSIVYGVVHEALGTITVTSDEGVGSCFTVYWPRAEAPTPGAQRATPQSVAEVPSQPMDGSLDAPTAPATGSPVAARAATAPSGDGATVLLVDDDDSVRRVVSRQLEVVGYRVISVSSGSEALAILQASGSAVRAMITDVRMPEMTGIELVDAMHVAGVDIPVLLVSGQLDAQIPTDWPMSSRRRFMSKPISGVALRKALDELLTTPPAPAGR